MRYLLLILLPFAALLANDLTTAVTENDPSSLVEGVSVITGDFYLGEEDYVVQGAEPISLGKTASPHVPSVLSMDIAPSTAFLAQTIPTSTTHIHSRCEPWWQEWRFPLPPPPLFYPLREGWHPWPARHEGRFLQAGGWQRQDLVE